MRTESDEWYYLFDRGELSSCYVMDFRRLSTVVVVVVGIAPDKEEVNNVGRSLAGSLGFSCSCFFCVRAGMWDENSPLMDCYWMWELIKYFSAIILLWARKGIGDDLKWWCQFNSNLKEYKIKKDWTKLSSQIDGKTTFPFWVTTREVTKLARSKELFSIRYVSGGTDTKLNHVRIETLLWNAKQSHTI